MGRRKLEIKRIQDKNCRQVAFCKRRKGIMKKANELSTLCDVDVAVVIISDNGKLHEFSTTNSMTGIFQRYETHVEAEKDISAEIQVAEEKLLRKEKKLLEDNRARIKKNRKSNDMSDLPPQKIAQRA